jgi:4,5-DOPA dioxygenase extradiol
LREQGVLIVASGNVVHNLRLVDPGMGERGTPRAVRFDEEARRIMTDQPRGVLDLLRHPDFEYAVPTPDHFLPLLYLAGLASAAGERCRTLVDGYVWGSLSMISYALGADLDGVPRSGGRAPDAGLPDPADVPPADTNI